MWARIANPRYRVALTQVNPLSLKYPISTKKGASGSAIMLKDSISIVGIHTRETDETLNQGVRITEDVKNEIYSWMH
ncbi:hypothetical protein Q764_00165 [Flavobacterium suncheonense GH29-5 = DSM 17707]|uniref:Serine protease n=1 Tax=Flavobacterium suncheonense GH29-5 = DSM 17707 TaxID=1121899 RepID=A0A0A2MGI9_9FLAO|nr:hypothetical protein Q764_00165 [Flavobacterium suncheonense GH29-5 = DSM 17707]